MLRSNTGMECNAEQSLGGHSEGDTSIITVIILGWRSVLSFPHLLFLSIRATLLSADTTEVEDVTYADVSVLQRRGQRREQGEGEVEYGAVRVAPGPRRTLETNVDECVYAQPRRTRP